MREKGLRDVQREAAEKDGEHENQFEVFKEGTEEGFLADAVPHEGEGEAEAVEDDDNGNTRFC